MSGKPEVKRKRSFLGRLSRRNSKETKEPVTSAAPAVCNNGEQGAKLEPGNITMGTFDSSSLVEEDLECQPNTWTNGTAETFNVRTPGYLEHSRKAPSKPALYRVFAFDVWRSGRKMSTAWESYNLPAREDLGAADLDVPPVIMVSILVPGYAPNIFGAGPGDGKGYSLIYFAELSEEARELVKTGKLSPSLKLVQEFIRQGVLENQKESHAKYRDRIKAIVRVINTKEAANAYGTLTSMLVSKYNSTPFLCRTSSSFHYEKGKILCIEIDAHKFGKLALRGLDSMRDYVQTMVFDMAIVIEAREEEHQPEQLLTVMRIAKTGTDTAKEFRFPTSTRE